MMNFCPFNVGRPNPFVILCLAFPEGLAFIREDLELASIVYFLFSFAKVEMHSFILCLQTFAYQLSFYLQYIILSLGGDGVLGPKMKLKIPRKI